MLGPNFCPCCGLLFNYCEEIGDCFDGGIDFTDCSGYIDNEWPRFFTKCPRCNNYIPERYLIRSSSRRAAIEIDGYLEEKFGLTKTKNTYILDRFYGLQTPEFWRDVVKKGLFYPSDVKENDKVRELRRGPNRKRPDVKENDKTKDLWTIYFRFWQCCNHTKGYDKNSREYKEIQNKLLELCDPDSPGGFIHTDDLFSACDKRLIRAEIYRNKGEFAKSMNELKKAGESYADGSIEDWIRMQEYLSILAVMTKANEDRITDTLFIPQMLRFEIVLRIPDCKYKKILIDNAKIVVVNLPEKFPEEIFCRIRSEKIAEDHSWSDSDECHYNEIQKFLKQYWNDPKKWGRDGSWKMYFVETALCLKELGEKYRDENALGDHYVLTYRNGELLLASKPSGFTLNYRFLKGFHIHNPYNASDVAYFRYVGNMSHEERAKKSKEFIETLDRLKDKIKVPVDSGKIVSVYELKDILIK